MNPIALQMSLLPGESLDDALSAAKASGADGVEFIANDSFYDDIPGAADALHRHGLKASALRVGHTRLVHPDYAERERAMVELQAALTAAVDIGASGVVFYAHYSPHHVLPDLEPYKAAVELEAELLITLLRKTVCDLANALDMRLLLAHGDSGTTALLRRPEHAAMIRSKLDDHPMLFCATSLAHLDAERLDTSAAMSVPGIGYVTVCDTDGRLPGSGTRDWNAWATAVQASGYDGWVTVEGNAAAPRTALAGSIRALRRAGL